MDKMTGFLKRNAVLLPAFVLAVISAFWVPPGAAYAGYIDGRTLALLFCLMAVVAGLNRLGVFRLLAGRLLARVHTVRGLSLSLCLLCFFSAMVITNDVALITFVPFSIVALRLSGKQHKLIPLVTLETVAANLGSMLTPIGNPQNLYLFSAYQMKADVFFTAILPYAVLSLVLVAVAALFMGREPVEAPDGGENARPSPVRCGLYAVLFVLALLTVFRVLPYPVTLAVTLAVMLATDRRALAQVDYRLLLTFLCLFVFIGNLGRMEAVSAFLREIVAGREVPVGVLASQILSNVPAAILLSGFTPNAAALLVGVNLGGLGTLIASMASLISFQLLSAEKVRMGQYLVVFTAVNAAFLLANLLLWYIIS